LKLYALTYLWNKTSTTWGSQRFSEDPGTEEKLRKELTIDQEIVGRLIRNKSMFGIHVWNYRTNKKEIKDSESR